MKEINFNVLVRRVEPLSIDSGLHDSELYIARCMDYSLIARGSSEVDAADTMLEVFLGTYFAYESKGRDMLMEHPRQEPFDVEMVEIGKHVCKAGDLRFTMTIFTTSSESDVSNDFTQPQRSQ